MTVPGYRLPTPRPTRTPISTHLWLAAAIGAFFALILFLARAPFPRVVGAGIVFAAVGFGLLRALEGGRVDWPAPPLGPASRTALTQRWRLGGFDAMVDKVPHLSPHLRLRLRNLATAILARRGLAAGSIGAAALLGSQGHELLFPTPRTADQGRPDDPTAEQLAALIDRLLDLGAPANRSLHGFNGSAAGQPAASASKGNR